jgi:hypothetical protein
LIRAFVTLREGAAGMGVFSRMGLPGFGGSKLVHMSPEYEPLERALNIVRLLGEPDRLRVAAAIVLGHERLTDIASVSGVDERDVGRALARLVAGGLVVGDRAGSYRFATEELKVAARGVASERDAPEPDAPRDAGRVLRAFVRGGTLTSIPATRSKRLVVLDLLVQGFEPGRRYREQEVNKQLSRWHADVAALRRLLVDEGFMSRERGLYWRTGGTFPVD